MSLRKLFPDGVYPSEYGGPEDRDPLDSKPCDCCGRQTPEHHLILKESAGMLICPLCEPEFDREEANQ